MPTAKKNPFFVLQYTFENGALRLNPYPILNQMRDKGPRLNLKGTWPHITDGAMSISAPIALLYTPVGHLGVLEFTLNDILRLRKEWTDQNLLRPEDINAYMLLGPVFGEKLAIPEGTTDERLRNMLRFGYRVIAVQFFTVEVEVPQALREDAEALRSAGLI